MQFGRKSEKLERQIEQLELRLEELESATMVCCVTRGGRGISTVLRISMLMFFAPWSSEASRADLARQKVRNVQIMEELIQRVHPELLQTKGA